MEKKRKGHEAGFSLVELLVVVAIILIVVAISFPSLLSSRINANESATVASLRTLNTAQIEYAQMYSRIGFAESLVVLGPAASADSQHAGLIDDRLANGKKNGYSYSVVAGSGGAQSANTQFTILAMPVGNAFGTNSYCTDESGIIKRTSITAPQIGNCVGFAM